MPVAPAALVCLVLMVTAPAAAQDAAGTSPQPSSPTSWRFAAGKGSFWIRDVARSRLGQGVDASPVSWQARGFAFTAERDRGSGARIRRLQASFEHSGDAVFRTPLAKVARPSGDGALRVGVTIEDGHYLPSDLGLRGFDVGFGLQGGADFASVLQHFEPSIEVRERESRLTAGAGVFVRLRRWRRAQLEATWVNGGAVVHIVTRHSAAADQAVRAWGVGWLSDVTARADVHVSAKVTLSGSYFGTGRGRFVSHGASASGRRRWTVGVSYGR